MPLGDYVPSRSHTCPYGNYNSLNHHAIPARMMTKLSNPSRHRQRAPSNRIHAHIPNRPRCQYRITPAPPNAVNSPQRKAPANSIPYFSYSSYFSTERIPAPQRSAAYYSITIVQKPKYPQLEHQHKEHAPKTKRISTAVLTQYAQHHPRHQFKVDVDVDFELRQQLTNPAPPGKCRHAKKNQEPPLR